MFAMYWMFYSGWRLRAGTYHLRSRGVKVYQFGPIEAALFQRQVFVVRGDYRPRAAVVPTAHDVACVWACVCAIRARSPRRGLCVRAYVACPWHSQACAHERARATRARLRAALTLYSPLLD